MGKKQPMNQPVGLAGAGCLGDVAAIAGQLEASTEVTNTASTRKKPGKTWKTMRVSSTKDKDFMWFNELFDVGPAKMVDLDIYWTRGW